MSRILAIIALVFLSNAISLNAQNLPEIGTLPDVYLFNGSGTSTVFLPQLSDGDGNLETVTILATSDVESMVTVGTITYSPDHNAGVLELNAAGINGTATITVSVTDSDGTVADDFVVTVGPYTNNGTNFEIHDIIFWQEEIPLSGVPVYDTVIQTTQAPYNEIDYESLDITVNAVKDDFFTGLYKGYLVPKVTGEYRFSILTENDGGVWVGNSIPGAVPRAVKSDEHGNYGSQDPDNNFMVVSAPVELEAGKVYGIYGVQWIVHATYGGILWEGPGIERSYITSEYLFTDYDTEKPSAPGGLAINIKGVTDLRFEWDPAEDNKEVTGYNIYLDGVKVNSEPLEATARYIDGLDPETSYTLAVTALDNVGNESAPSNLLTVSTYPVDNDPPQPPTEVVIVTIAGLAMEIEWSGASDAETAVNGYNVYIDGVQFNSSPILDAMVILDGLSPETTYSVTVEAIDAGGNVSAQSAPFLLTTTAFDPLGNNLGVKSGRFSFDTEQKTYSHGIGVNPDYKNGAVFNAAHDDMFTELRPGSIRWGALTANPLSFSTYVGAGKSVTIGRFMELCNSYDAITVFCCGVNSNTDWIQNEQTFANFMEYIAGPAGTTYGDMRIAEGYTGSLLENSPGLIFEFGNEVWGGESHSAPIGEDYFAYAEWCREMAQVIKSSPYYDPDKVMLAYSGRYPSPQNSYGVNEKLYAGDTGVVDLIAFSGYLGGNLDYDPAIPQGESELDYYKNAMVLVAENIAGMDFYAKETLLSSDEVKSAYLYESNMTTPAYNARHGQAIISTDYYLTAIEHGAVVPTIFHLTGGQWRITDPTNGYERLPLFKTAKLVNRFCKGYALGGEYHTTNQLLASNGTVIDYPAVGCHAYHAGGSYALVFLSRDFESDHTVQVDIPDGLTFDPAAKMYMVSSDGYSSRDAAVDSMDIDVSDGMFVTVPKYGMVVITFSGEDISQEPLPGLGAYPYKKQQTISITGEEYSITNDRGRADFVAEVMPSDAFMDRVRWEMIDNEIGADIIVYKNSCTIKASGDCDGNGILKLRATAPGSPDVYDEIEIVISSQKGPECLGVEQREADRVVVYPIPAKHFVQVELQDPVEFDIRIITATGRKVFEGTGYSETTDIDVSNLKRGVYILQVIIGDTRVNKMLVVAD